MNSLHRHLDAILSDPADTTTIVFPSEIAAAFWRRSAIKSGPHAALREDRLISWDTFKERAFEIRERAVPVNRTVRTVFAEMILRENAESPFLRALVAPEYAAGAAGFVGTIVSVLPGLRDASAALDASPHNAQRNRRLADLRADLGAIHSRYVQFLDSHGFFEPRWLQAEQRYRGGSYLLVLPNLAEDFPEFRAALSNVARFRPDVPSATISVYDESKSELRGVFAEVSRLLDAGTEADDISITVCDLEHLADRVRHEADRYDVPMVLRAGRSLGDSAVGRFIRDIGEVVRSGFAVDDLRRLVLNMAVPWRDRVACARLVVAGLEAGVLGGTTAPDSRWRRVARGAERGGEDRRDEEPRERAPAELYRQLQRQLQRLLPPIVRARSFEELRRVFNAALGHLVDRDAWSPANERLLERSQEELRSLADLEESTGLRVDAPYRFWVDRLREKLYVPRTAEAGVTVLPYRVGAGIAPEHHFVVNASQAGTAVVIRRFPFLREPERDVIGEAASDRDLSAEFIDAYAASGAHVRFSASRSTFEGPALPAGPFVVRGAVCEVSSEQREREREADPYVAEEQFRLPGTPTALQSDGAASYAMMGAATGAGASEAASAAASQGTARDYTQVPIEDETLRSLVVGRLRSPEHPDLLRLSASQIDAFRACPFGYLLMHGLGLAELTLAPEPDDARELGQLYHEIIARFYQELKDSERPFSAAALPEYRDRIEVIADECYRRRHGMVPDIVYRANREMFTRIARRLLEHDAGLINGHRPVLVEAREETAELVPGVLLVARIDRATRAPDGTLLLVDYKKSHLPPHKEVNAGSPRPTGGGSGEAELLGSVQMPLYVTLLEAGGEQVSGAGFYSLERGEYRALFGSAGEGGKASMVRERMDEILAIASDLVGEMVRRVHRGDYSCGARCDGCPMQGICRTGFAVQ